MKNKSDPDLRFAEALSELDDTLIGEFLDGEDRLSARRAKAHARRLAALAACLIVAIGAGMVIFTEGAPGNKTVPKTTATDPARETEEPPRTQNDSAGLPPRIYAEDKEWFSGPISDEDKTFDPGEVFYNTKDGTVVITDPLRELIEKNDDEKALFYVVINAHSEHLRHAAEEERDALLSVLYDKAETVLEEYEAHKEETSHIIEGFPEDKTVRNPDCVLLHGDCPVCSRIYERIQDIFEEELDVLFDYNYGFDVADLRTSDAAEAFVASCPELFSDLYRRYNVAFIELPASPDGEPVKHCYRLSFIAYMTENSIETLEKTLRESEYNDLLALQVDILPMPHGQYQYVFGAEKT